MLKLHCFLLIIFVVLKVSAVPPAVCRAEFRWDDCGKPAKPVMYYWKQGSRCEIGYWKGCLPNPNMFADEYECINTCVFVDRPPPTETEAPETVTVTNYENITSIVTDSIPTEHNVNESTADITNGSTTKASSETNQNETSPKKESEVTHNNETETTNDTSQHAEVSNETTSDNKTL